MLTALWRQPHDEGSGFVRVAEQARTRGATRLYWMTQDDNARARLLYDKVASFNGFIRYDYPL